uniref:FLZ-type domain-containing protein n=1 Tax=Aegilops tauschii subsp. strangulata TaxID=200361 RepID=A0A453KVJ5_AEGTS
MLPRIQKSIFHLGEEGGDGHRSADDQRGDNIVDIQRGLGGHTHGRRLRRVGGDAASDVVVGLQILVQHHPQPCHVVLKQMVSSPPARRRLSGSFSGACFLCRRELSPDKDVYMYRGDQGFCSEECRRQQILSDEAREHEAMVSKERRTLAHRRHHHGPRPSPPVAIRGAPRRLLAAG